MNELTNSLEGFNNRLTQAEGKKWDNVKMGHWNCWIRGAKRPWDEEKLTDPEGPMGHCQVDR